MRELLTTLGGICVLALGACGGDDDAPIVPVPSSTGTSGPQLDQDEFVDEADSICQEANAALASLSTDTTGAALASTIAEQRDVYDGTIEQIDGLGPPPEDEATLDDFLDGLASVVDALDKQELAAERDETTQVEALSTDVDSALSEAQAAADDFGLKECSQSEDTTATDTGADTGTDTGAAPAPAPAPTPAPAPAPAPAPTPAPAPAPAPDDTGGTDPGGSGGVSP